MIKMESLVTTKIVWKAQKKSKQSKGEAKKKSEQCFLSGGEITDWEKWLKCKYVMSLCT